MKRRNAPLFAALLVAGFSTYATSGADAAKPVLKVDSVTASAVSGAPNRLVIHATGAVNSGGWQSPRLRVKIVPESKEMIIVFVAIPPAVKKTVVQAVLPVRATLTVLMPKEQVVSVKVASETNSVSAKIVR